MNSFINLLTTVQCVQPIVLELILIALYLLIFIVSGSAIFDLPIFFQFLRFQLPYDLQTIFNSLETITSYILFKFC